MKYNKNHMQKILNDPLPQLPEDERIYLNVPYQERNFAKIANCGFDKEKKELFMKRILSITRNLSSFLIFRYFFSSFINIF